MVITFFASLIEYYLYTKFRQNRSNFLWKDGRTDIRKFDTHIIRSTSKVWKSTESFFNKQKMQPKIKDCCVNRQYLNALTTKYPLKTSLNLNNDF